MEFNKNIERLEEILEKLEGGKVDLNEGVKLYDEGAKLLKSLDKELSTNKNKITILKKELDKVVEEKFEGEE
jgi:exodeoxyribonuclease VII small subunit